MHKLLVVDDDQDITLLLQKYFTKKGFEVDIASNGKDAISWLKDHPVDLVLCDFKLPDYSGIDILQKIKIINSGIQVIIITGYSDVKVAVEAVKKGAYEYVTKPLYPDEILMTVKSALEKKNEEKSEKRKKSTSKGRSNKQFIVGTSPQSLSVQKHIELIAPTDMSVIISGETGTGKEYVARAIHDKSERKGNPFIAVDCGALPKDLAGSELFGHVKGAFTSAISDKKGCFELASTGTLFLDEIGNLSYDNQVKLLRVLQERVVKKVGGVKDIEVDVRVIVASNENLREAVSRGEFREDIYHRLNEFRIEIAPLRERQADIETYAHHFLQAANKDLGKNVQGFDEEAFNTLKNYYWHGNLRELRNVVKRSVLLCKDEKIKTMHLPSEITLPSNTDGMNLQVSFSGGSPGSLKSIAEAAEKKAIIETLRLTNNNKSKTADLLEIDRKTLYNKLKAYQIDI